LILPVAPGITGAPRCTAPRQQLLATLGHRDANLYNRIWNEIPRRCQYSSGRWFIDGLTGRSDPSSKTVGPLWSCANVSTMNRWRKHLYGPDIVLNHLADDPDVTLILPQ
jgi:hypothetical protein